MTAHLFLVEGKDEQELCRHQLSTYPMNGFLGVLDCGGICKYGEELRLVVRPPSSCSTRTITVVGDAGDSAAAAFESAPNALRAAFPHVQSCIVPDNGPEGCIEDRTLQAHKSSQAPIHACLDSLRKCGAPHDPNPARRAKSYTADIIRSTLGDYASEFGNALQKSAFHDVLNQEPLLQLARILHRVQTKSHA